MDAFSFWRNYCEAWRETGTAADLKNHQDSWGAWTEAVTRLVHGIGKKVGLVPVDKALTSDEQQDFKLGKRKEYFTVDSTWFPKDFVNGEGRWCLPEVAIEIQNPDPSYEWGLEERYALALWKLLCVRCPLRVLIAFLDPKEYGSVLSHLEEYALRPLLETPGCGGRNEVIIALDTSEDEWACDRWQAFAYHKNASGNLQRRVLAGEDELGASGGSSE